MSKLSDLVQGTLDLLILKIIMLEPMNGWGIGQRLKTVLWRCPAGERWIALSGSAQAGAGGMDSIGMESHRE